MKPVVIISISFVLTAMIGPGWWSAMWWGTGSERPCSWPPFVPCFNRLLYQDTVKSGNFFTLFYLEVDWVRNSITWVRCGHEPAIVYSPARGQFSELSGPGVALGISEGGGYQGNEIPLVAEPHYVLIYSDGACEARNEEGNRFGRERLKRCLAACHGLEVREMLTSITESIIAFQGKAQQQDDITLAVIKIF